MPYKQPDGSTKNGPAQYNSWMQLTQSQLDAIVAVEGAETGEPGKLERFAQLVHVVNSTASSGGGGPIQDGVTDTILATVDDLANSNPLATMLVDANGDQIENLQTIGNYETDTYQNLDGSISSASSTVFATEESIRIISYDADNWIKRTAGAGTAVSTEGLLLLTGSEISMIVNAGDVISTIGGKLNITIINR